LVIDYNQYNLIFWGIYMGLFDRYKKKVKEEMEELTCNVCGSTLKNYKNSKNMKVCEECFSKINED